MYDKAEPWVCMTWRIYMADIFRDEASPRRGRAYYNYTFIFMYTSINFIEFLENAS